MVSVAEKLDDLGEARMRHLVEGEVRVLDSYRTGRGPMVSIWSQTLGKRLTFVMPQGGDAPAFDGGALYCDDAGGACLLSGGGRVLPLDPLTASGRVIRGHLSAAQG